MSTTPWAVTAVTVCLYCVSSQGAPAHECGGTITEDGVFLSPDPLDERYKGQESLECVWRIEAPEDRRVILKILKYSLNEAYTCSERKDHIAVFDGITTDKEKRLAILCTKGQYFVIPSSENTLTLTFKTNKFNKMTGFVSKIVFTFSKCAGCGKNINLKSEYSYLLRSPRIRNYKKGDAFECIWNFVAPENYAIKIAFASFKKFTCKYNHLLEIRDGNVPDSLILGTFCGKKLPPVIVSSSNRLSVRLSSSEKSQFTAIVSVTSRPCNSLNYVYNENKAYKSPVYDYGYLYNGIHCGLQFRANSNTYPVRVTIKNLDIAPGTVAGKCDKDKLILGTRSSENALGEHYKSNYNKFNYLSSTSKLNHLYNKYTYLARQFELCGKKSVEFYFPGTFFLNLITAPGDNGTAFRGFEIDVSYAMFCGRNYTEPYGRILSTFDSSLDDCYTLISAPEGYTISLYFLSIEPDLLYNFVYVEVFDGKSTDARKIMSTKSDPSLTVFNIPKPIFSTSNFLLIKNKKGRFSQTNFDANYMITNKGRGCGGYYYADQGVLTSPLYPETYREIKSCEWEIETPVSTLLHMTFDEFDLSGDCTSNYVELVGRDDKVLSKFCSGKPENFKSNDNYVKIVYVTAHNNNGKGWYAMFRAEECRRCRHHH